MNLNLFHSQQTAKKTGRFISQAPLRVARHGFFILVLLILCDIAIGEFLFYHYVFLAETEPPAPLPSAPFHTSQYQQVTGAFQSRDVTLQQLEGQSPQDPFQ